MKRLLAFITMLAMTYGAFCYAYDTYLFRVKVDNVTKKQDVEDTFKVKGRVNEQDQPFYGTYTLVQSDTNYVLVKITPSDDAEYREMKINFGIPGVDLYREYDPNDLTYPRVDNSKQFPVDYDWSVIRSSK